MSRWDWDHISARLPLSTMNATHPGTKNSLVTLALLRPLIGGVKCQVPVVVWVISSTSPSFHRPSPPTHRSTARNQLTDAVPIDWKKDSVAVFSVFHKMSSMVSKNSLIGQVP